MVTVYHNLNHIFKFDIFNYPITIAVNMNFAAFSCVLIGKAVYPTLI